MCDIYIYLNLMSKPLLPEILLCQFFELDEVEGDSKWRLIDIGHSYVNKQSVVFELMHE